MNTEFEKFANEIKDRIFENSGDRDNLKIEVHHVQKVNQMDQISLSVAPKESNVAPSIPLSAAFEAYKEGQSMESILHSLENTILNHTPTQNVDVSCITSFENVKDHIFPKLINKDMNKELLDNVPHYDFGDLAVTFFVRLDPIEEIGSGTVTVNKQLFEGWGVEDKTVMDAAMDNLKANTQCKDMFGVIEDLNPSMASDLRPDIPDNQMPMVVSTDSQTFGAAAILNEDIMKALAERMGGEVIILPSSIHECLVVCDNGDPAQEIQMTDMVQAVNETTVAPEDLLSDHIYHFNGEEIMMRELPKNADIDTVINTPFTNLELKSAQTGEVYWGKDIETAKEQDKSLTNDKAQEKSTIVNIEDKKQAPKRDDLAI